MDHGRSRPDLRRPRLSRASTSSCPTSSSSRSSRSGSLGIVLTHGHEDHIGALPYLAEELKAPLYATPFTAGLIAGKLEEEGLTGQVKLNIVERGGSVELGPFKVSFVALSHSIPEGNGAADRDAVRQHLPHRRLEDRRDAGARRGAEHRGADRRSATRACSPWCAIRPTSSRTSRRAPRRASTKACSRRSTKAKGRVLVTTFASNAARLQTIGRVATRNRAQGVHRRPLARAHPAASPRRPAISRDFPPPISFDEAMRLPRERGADHRHRRAGRAARRARAASPSGNHELKLAEGDTVIFSSRIIPGNEIAIGRIMNQLSDLGVQIVTEKQAHVHVSGHPGRPELIEMYDWVRPRDRRAGPWRGAASGRAGAARARPRRPARASSRRMATSIRLAPGEPEEDRRSPRRPAGARRRRHPSRRRLDDQRAPADRLQRPDHRRRCRSASDGELAGTPLVRPFGVPVEEDRDDFIADATDAATTAFSPGGDEEKSARGGAARGPPLRDAVDGQEAAGRGDAAARSPA